MFKNLVKFYSLAFFILLEGLDAQNVTNTNSTQTLEITNLNLTDFTAKNESVKIENSEDVSDKVVLSLSDLFLDPEDHDIENENKTKTVIEREVAKKPTPTKEVHRKIYHPADISIFEDAIVSLEDMVCKEHIQAVLNGMKTKELWALKMLDSSAKFPEGILTGSKYQLGNYDECMSIKYFEENSTIPTIQGKYCLLDVTPNHEINLPELTPDLPRNELNKTIHWAICVPHSCRSKEIQKVLSILLNNAIERSQYIDVQVPENMCHIEKEIPFTTLELIYGYIIVAFCALITLSTIYHTILYYYKQNYKVESGILTEVVLSFSLIKNVRKLFKIGPSNDLNLNCLCGIKFIAMMLIISGHALVFLIGSPVINETFFNEAIHDVQNTIFLNNPLLVDTFLLISGFLMCRLVLIELDKRKGNVNFAVICLFRYIRLTPAYLVVIGFYCTWFIRMNEGPLWDSKIGLERERCLESWWANVLYINNYVSTDNLCMFQSWYLSVDTQMFMLAPFIVYPLWKWKRIGHGLLVGVTVISILIPFLVTFANHLDPTLMFFAPEIQDLTTNWYFINVYIKTHMRASAYCFGLLFGYIVHRIQEADYKLPKKILIPGWILGPSCLVISMCSVLVFYDSNYKYDVWEASTYSALHRSVWCIGTGWILLACITNNGGPIQKLLCWRPFIPLSRLTYCVYLVNGIVELHDAATLRSSHYMSVYHLACNVLAHMVLTLTAAFILCVTFESPIHGFEKILLRKEKKIREKNNNIEA